MKEKPNPSIPLQPTNRTNMPPSFFRISFFLLLLASCKTSQKITKVNTALQDSLKAHIQYLADDKLEGRRTGTPGEQLAVDYITAEFKSIGLIPKGTEYYIQSFPVNDGKQIGPATSLSINDNILETGKDFFPFPYSPDIKIEALPAIAVQEADMPWFFDLKEILEENKTNPHFDLPDYIRTNSKKAKDRSASAVILYNTSSIDDKLVFEAKDRSEQMTIPVIYVSKQVAEKYFADKSATLNIKLRVSIGEKNRIGHNVIGYVDNRAATTVILGAHFDHLGYGEDGNSMIRNFDHPMIHNGADDNASGTAALIELARILKDSKATNNNYLFIAFSGEELGLFGSKYFTEHPTVDLKDVNYMINMDMVGRLNDSSRVLTIGGYGTSPEWSAVISKDYFATPNSAKKTTPSLTIRIDSSGTGPSDHTSFYRKDIPVLFYFTGLHSDYHKPSDDADKINYDGEAVIIRHIDKLIESLDDKEKLAFLKTRETQSSTNTRFSVSMGIMPDYTFAGTGVRADGVTDGKPAQKAGLKAGDIILQLGDNTVTSLENYMQALGKFKKGDKTKVKFKRGTETMETIVEF
ncbi:MAG: M20/M25/M40 family metallo-hydrolase [Chitinophagaceae bacterium]